jgi:hypothetical protein
MLTTSYDYVVIQVIREVGWIKDISRLGEASAHGEIDGGRTGRVCSVYQVRNPPEPYIRIGTTRQLCLFHGTPTSGQHLSLEYTHSSKRTFVHMAHIELAINVGCTLDPNSSLKD